MKIDKSVNMQLWNAVEKTDPKYTKEVGFGRKFTSINAQYQIMTATEQFGSIGDGWGVTSEKFEMVCEGLLGYQAIFWYMLGDERAQFDLNSSIKTHTNAGKWDDNRYVNQVKEDYNKKPSMEVTHPKNSFKKKMDKIVLDTMLEFIDDGKADMVQKKLPDYTMTKAQATKINDAIIQAQNA